MNIVDLFENPTFQNYFWKVVPIVILGIVLLIFLKINKKVFKKLLAKDRYVDKKNTLVFIRKSITFIICLLFFALMINQIDAFQALSTSLLAGSGIAAIAVSFAAQETLSNVIGGILITLFKPFKVGDVITYLDKNLMGYVEEITIRHTIIRTYNNRRIIIPNGLVNKEIIENSTFGNEEICLFMEINIAYDADVEKATRIIAEEAFAHKNYLDKRKTEADPPVKVKMVRWDNSSVVLRAWIWGKDQDTTFDMVCDLYKNIKKRFDDEDIEIPYPCVNVINK